MQKKLFTCYLIGDDHLLLECADVLLSYNHSILGIISATPAAQDYAIRKKIPYFKKLAQATSILSITNFDYLFSIVNRSILPLSLLQRAQCMAINFHNAPLPKYAGLHAPSWAILNNEKFHGVSWHEMVEEIDAGDILKQSLIEIAPNETGLSLSVKCYQNAVNTFNELIYEISSQAIHKAGQNLSNRSYFDYYKKPHHGGWISWNETGEQIDRLCRALDLGHHHANRLGLPKFNIGNDFFLVSQAKLLNVQSTELPGTLISITPDFWQIATKTQVVQLERVISLNNKSFEDFSDLATQFNLKEKSILASESEKNLHAYKSLYEVYALHELHWVRENQYFNPALFPFQTTKANNNQLTCIATLNLASAFRSLSDEYPNNPAHLLFASLLIYLYRLGNKERFGVGFSHPKLHQLPKAIGPLFSTILPFSLHLTDELTVGEFLASFFKQIVNFDKHLSYSNDIYYRYPELSSSLQNYYPITVVIGHEHSLEEQIQSINASIIITISNTYKMQWHCREAKQDLLTIIKNSTKHLPILLDGIIKNPTMSIARLPLLSVKEKKEILIDWNATQTAYPKDKTVTELFVEQAAKTPNQIALIYENYSLTYQELNAQSNQLAHLLQKKGIAANAHIVICTDDKLHLIKGVLAILKVEACYIPIDTNYPASHIQFILSDSSATIALASNSVKAKMQNCCEMQNVPLYLFEELFDDAKAESEANLQLLNSGPESLAYIIYTSGTTGKPKGVMIPHRGVSRLVKATNYIDIKEGDRVAQAASISFDAVTFEIWGALLNGATLVGIPHTTLLSISQFERFLSKHSISILWLTSALFNQYAAESPAMFNMLTYLLVGGDVLNAEHIMRVQQCEKGAPKFILNGYGPTENTTFTTTYLIKPQKEGYQAIPIGKPIANTTAYILDGLLQPCPIGAPGELYTGGDGVGLGYLNRPDINDNRFIPNCFDPESRSLLYKTGDIVRWLPNGEIDYLGKQDNQVKIRGFRVELEAIYTVLLHHEAIQQCAVRVYENEKGQKFIVAYLVLCQEIPIISIQKYLSDELPAYMVPSFFIAVDNIPLTLNGKVDFSKMPPPDFSTHALRADYVAPHTETEKKVETIWSELFELEQIGIHDSFFDLGGHSLMVTQLVLAVNEELGYELPLQQFLETPTIFNLADLIDETEKDQVQSSSFTLHWQFDSEFNISLSPNALPPFDYKPQAILLTGATGFLGANLLAELVKLTNATVYCLIRGKNPEEAQAKFAATLERYRLPVEEISARVEILLGDLEKPYLGLAISDFMLLSEKIDIIYHNGAAVHHLYNYDMLRMANVNSVKEILKLATITKQIPIHYISTLSAATNFTDNQGAILEDFIYSHPNPPPTDGYSQTKWVAEQLLAKAHQQLFPVKIYRPGWILGHSRTGAISTEQTHFLRLIKGCIQLGYAPAWDILLDILPVDYVSEFVVKTSLNPKIPYHLFNLANPNKLGWQDLISYINRRGYPVQLIAPEKWRSMLVKSINSDNTLFSLLTLYVNQDDKDWMKGLNKIAQAYNQNTIYAFKENKMDFPVMNQQILNTYFSYLEKTAFLKTNLIYTDFVK